MTIIEYFEKEFMSAKDFFILLERNKGEEIEIPVQCVDGAKVLINMFINRRAANENTNKNKLNIKFI